MFHFGESPRRRSFMGKMTSVVIITVVPMIVLLMTATFYSIVHSNTLLAESNQRVVNQWTEQINENLSMIGGSLASVAYIEPEFGTMGRNAGELNVHLASYTISQRLDTMLHTFSPIAGLFMYSPRDNKWVARWASGYTTYAFRQETRAYFTNSETANLPNGQWTIREIGGKSMLIYVISLNDASLIAMVDFAHFIELHGSETDVLYLDAAGKILYGRRALTNTEQMVESDACVYLSDTQGSEYMTVSAPLDKAPVTVLYAVSHKGYWDGLTRFQNVLLIISLMMLGMIPLSRYLIKRNVGTPLMHLTESMERIRDGEMDTQLPGEYKSLELERLRLTFNAMMSRIQSLKIEVYEKELNRQKAELQYRHLQLRPHFFLNCMKNIYALAEQKRYHEIQEMLLAVSNYIRYLFRDNQTKVRLRDEIKYVNDFMEIQRLSRREPPTCEICVDDALLNCMVLPLSVEAFVENAVKHQSIDQVMRIRVNIVRLGGEDGDMLDITVRNNGGLFTAEILDQLNGLTESMENAGHIGMSNLRHRLELLYGAKAVLAFYNEPDMAVCELIYPLEKEVDG